MIQIPGLETYFGGKGASGAYQKIINHIPACDCLISGFLGADFVIRNMNNLPTDIVGIDIDPRVTDLWRSAAGTITSKMMIHNNEFLKVFKNIIHYNDSKFKTPFFYLDPPYPWKTRKSKHRYKFEMTDQDL